MFGYTGLCDQCERRPATVARDDGDYWCIDCVDNDNEAAWERQQVADFADFHGGVAPQSVYDATYGKVR